MRQHGSGRWQVRVIVVVSADVQRHTSVPTVRQQGRTPAERWYVVVHASTGEKQLRDTTVKAMRGASVPLWRTAHNGRLPRYATAFRCELRVVTRR